MVETDIDAILDHAIACHEGNRLELAEEAYRSVLLQDPDNPDALNLFGLLLQDTGRLRESEQLLTKATELDPHFAEALANLARVKLALGQAESAADAALQATEHDPELWQGHLLLGRALSVLKDHQGAAAALMNARALKPGDPEILVTLGRSLVPLGRMAEAQNGFQEAFTKAPAILIHRLAASAAYLDAGLYQDAADLCRKATELDHQSIDAWAGLATALYHLQEPSNSNDACRQALALAPKRVDLKVLMGLNFSTLGDFDQAENVLRSALGDDPKAASALRALAMIGRLSADEASQVDLNSMIDDPRLTLAERSAAGFALGFTLDAAGAYDEAFAAFQAANRLVTGSLKRPTIDPDELDSFAYGLENIFTPGLFGRMADLGDSTDSLVFVVGMPRTGTTLVEQILASHPRIYGAGENKTVQFAIETLNTDLSQTSPDTWTPDAIKAAADQILEVYRGKAGGKPIIVEKLPDNLFFLGQIAILFPRARIIFCNRDARDTCLSCYFQRFSDNIHWSFDLAACAEQSYYARRVSDLWHRVLPLRILDVHYEDLARNLEQESRRLIDFVGLDWDPVCLSFHETKRTVTTSSYWQVRQKINENSIGRWRHYARHLTGLTLALIGLLPDLSEDEWTTLLAEPADAMSIAAVHEMRSRHAEAERIYEKLTQRDPSNGAAWHRLGRLCYMRGNFVDAKTMLHRAYALLPPNPSVLTDLSEIALVTGETDAAIGYARDATEIAPNDIEPWCQLGFSLLKSDAPGSAIDAMQHAYQIAPDNRTALLSLASAFLTLNRSDDAEAIWRDGLARFPNDPAFIVGLAQSLGMAGRHNDAINVLAPATVAFPDNGNIHGWLGASYLRINDTARARRHLTRAVTLEPENVPFWIHLGSCLATEGHYDDSAAAYRSALALDPSNGEALSGLILTAKQTATPDMVATLLHIIPEPGRETVQRASAAFALADHYERRHDYAEAFAAYQTANALFRETRHNFNAAEQEDEINRLTDMEISYFWPHKIAELSTFANPSSLPVFITGMPRSGSTLLEQILASHPDVFAAGEEKGFLDALGPQAVAMLSGDETLWNQSVISEATSAFVEDLRQQSPLAKRVVNKMLANIFHIGYIAALFPNAKIIISRRDPRDACWSCFTKRFRDDGLGWSDSLEGCAFYARQLERLNQHWRAVLPGRFLEVNYEDVVADLETEARRVIDYIGLEWDPACLDFHRHSRPVATASHWQVRQPLYSTSLGRWKPYKQFLGPMLDGLAGLVPLDT